MGGVRVKCQATRDKRRCISTVRPIAYNIAILHFFGDLNFCDIFWPWNSDSYEDTIGNHQSERCIAFFGIKNPYFLHESMSNTNF